jgi:hypothetical protein
MKEGKEERREEGGRKEGRKPYLSEVQFPYL